MVIGMGRAGLKGHELGRLQVGNKRKTKQAALGVWAHNEKAVGKIVSNIQMVFGFKIKGFKYF
jgi:hypothetical protein